jgi:hypothetical protein
MKKERGVPRNPANFYKHSYARGGKEGVCIGKKK